MCDLLTIRGMQSASQLDNFLQQMQQPISKGTVQLFTLQALGSSAEAVHVRGIPEVTAVALGGSEADDVDPLVATTRRSKRA